MNVSFLILFFPIPLVRFRSLEILRFWIETAGTDAFGVAL